MFKETSRQQPLFGAGQRLGRSAAQRLENSWPETFRNEVYAVLLEVEGDFAVLYGATARPVCVPGALGVILRQEMPNLCSPPGPAELRTLRHPSRRVRCIAEIADSVPAVSVGPAELRTLRHPSRRVR